MQGHNEGLSACTAPVQRSTSPLVTSNIPRVLGWEVGKDIGQAVPECLISLQDLCLELSEGCSILYEVTLVQDIVKFITEGLDLQWGVELLLKSHLQLHPAECTTMLLLLHHILPEGLPAEENWCL